MVLGFLWFFHGSCGNIIAKVFENKGNKNVQISSIFLEKTQKKAFVNEQTLQLYHQSLLNYFSFSFRLSKISKNYISVKDTTFF